MKVMTPKYLATNRLQVSKADELSKTVRIIVTILCLFACMLIHLKMFVVERGKSHVIDETLNLWERRALSLVSSPFGNGCAMQIKLHLPLTYEPDVPVAHG